MTYTVRLSGIAIGYSELEQDERPAGLRRGAFRPAAGYDLVEPIFRLAVQAPPTDAGGSSESERMARYRQARAALPLELIDATGARVPTTYIHIEDLRPEQGPDAIRLEVAEG
jgi:hypothetical protein